MEKEYKLRKFLQKSLYAHKWILLIFYIGGVLGLGAYAFTYIRFIIYFFTGGHIGHEEIKSFWNMNENEMIMAILTIIDVIMVANLVKMIITGSYQSFIDKVPENTEKVSSGLLKVKMGTSLIGITSIHLLQAFIDPPKENRDLYIKIGTHIVFLASAMALAWIDYIHSKSELAEANAHEIEHKYELKFETNKDETPHL